MKKQKVNIINNNGSIENKDYRNLIILVVVISAIFLVFYLLTSMFTKKNNDNIFKNDLNNTEIQYKEIIIGDMFNKEGTYYALLLEKDEPYKVAFDSYINQVRENHTLYTVDLTSGFNKKYISDEYNYDEDNFKTKGTLLLKLKDGKIVNHYSDKDEILNKIKELSED